MFAVPGWNVSTTVKPQSQPADQKASKKRKRKEEEPKHDKNKGIDLANFNNLDDKKKKTPKADGPPKRLSRAERRKRGKEEWLKKSAGGEVDLQEKESWSDRKKKRKQEEMAKADGEVAQEASTAPELNVEKTVVPLTKAASIKSSMKGSAESKANDAQPKTNKPALTPLQAAMAHKLSSARFRHLNETLYTTPSAKSLALFEKNPEMFDDYHAGFSQQVAVWPENPVDNFIQDILERARVGQADGKGKGKFGNKNIKGRKGAKDAANPNLIPVNALGTKPLPRTGNPGISYLADLGCGTARLASTLQPQLSKLHLKIHSFDLHSPSPLVTKADISRLPLEDGSLDVTIFCLALMGTNWTDFIDEAYRCLHWKGECWVGEIRSRFGRSGGAQQNGSGKTVKHSIGSIDKRKQLADNKNGKGKNKKKKADSEDEDSEDSENDGRPSKKQGPARTADDFLNTEIDDPDQHAAAQVAAQQDTDLGPFISVMRAHGFGLEGEADLSNKMFVKMVFIKNTAPTRGKNVQVKEEVKRAGGGKSGKRFVDKEEVAEEDEGRVLKPCVYKLR